MEDPEQAKSSRMRALMGRRWKGRSRWANKFSMDDSSMASSVNENESTTSFRSYGGARNNHPSRGGSRSILKKQGQQDDLEHDDDETDDPYTMEDILSIASPSPEFLMSRSRLKAKNDTYSTRLKSSFDSCDDDRSRAMSVNIREGDDKEDDAISDDSDSAAEVDEMKSVRQELARKERFAEISSSVLPKGKPMLSVDEGSEPLMISKIHDTVSSTPQRPTAPQTKGSRIVTPPPTNQIASSSNMDSSVVAGGPVTRIQRALIVQDDESEQHLVGINSYNRNGATMQDTNHLGHAVPALDATAMDRQRRMKKYRSPSNPTHNFQQYSRRHEHSQVVEQMIPTPQGYTVQRNHPAISSGRIVHQTLPPHHSSSDDVVTSSGKLGTPQAFYLNPLKADPPRDYVQYHYTRGSEHIPHSLHRPPSSVSYGASSYPSREEIGEQPNSLRSRPMVALDERNVHHNSYPGRDYDYPKGSPRNLPRPADHGSSRHRPFHGGGATDEISGQSFRPVAVAGSMRRSFDQPQQQHQSSRFSPSIQSFEGGRGVPLADVAQRQFPLVFTHQPPEYILNNQDRPVQQLSRCTLYDQNQRQYRGTPVESSDEATSRLVSGRIPHVTPHQRPGYSVHNQGGPEQYLPRGSRPRQVDHQIGSTTFESRTESNTNMVTDLSPEEAAQLEEKMLKLALELSLADTQIANSSGHHDTPTTTTGYDAVRTPLALGRASPSHHPPLPNDTRQVGQLHTHYNGSSCLPTVGGEPREHISALEGANHETNPETAQRLAELEQEREMLEQAIEQSLHESSSSLDASSLVGASPGSARTPAGGSHPSGIVRTNGDIITSPARKNSYTIGRNGSLRTNLSVPLIADGEAPNEQGMIAEVSRRTPTERPPQSPFSNKEKLRNQHYASVATPSHNVDHSVAPSVMQVSRTPRAHSLEHVRNRRMPC